MMKVIGKILITAIVIALIVWVASMIFSFSYSVWSFFIGLGITIVLLFFNSSGGGLSTTVNFEASESVGMSKILEHEEPKVNVGIVFYGSVLYTVISFIMMIYIYFF